MFLLQMGFSLIKINENNKRENLLYKILICFNPQVIIELNV